MVDDKINGVRRDYTCSWCGNEFKQVVRKVIGNDMGKRATVSDQVKCPSCHNFIRTWD